MAGSHGALRPDPALERWNNMREDVYKHFKFTPSVTRKIFFWAGVIPLATYFMASNQDYKWDWAGKTKTESAYRVPPASESSPKQEE